VFATRCTTPATVVFSTTHTLFEWLWFLQEGIPGIRRTWGIRTRNGGQTTDETAITDFTGQTCGIAAFGAVAFSEVEGRVLAGGLSSLRMEAAAIIVSLDNSLGREGFQKYPCRQFPAVELKEFWPDSYTRGYIYSVGDRFRSQDVLPYSRYTAVSRNNVPIS